MKISDIRVGAVFVLYNPTDAFRVALEHVKNSSIEKIVIIDNSPELSKALGNLLPFDKRLLVIQNFRNNGVAHALNVGCEKLMELGYDAALLMDQDSIFETNEINSLLDEASCLRDTDVGALAPKVFPITADSEFVNFLLPGDTIWSPRRISVKNDNKHILFCITSGSLIYLNHWKKIGRFDERLFIEYVDTDYCLRLNIAGFKTIMVGSTKLYQRYGAMEQHKLFNVTFNPTHHAPLRYYYVSRNKFLVWKKIFKNVPGYILWDVASGFKRGLTVIIFEKQRLKKIYFSLLGFWHFIIGKWGGYE